jgi:hypothetical protein
MYWSNNLGSGYVTTSNAATISTYWYWQHIMVPVQYYDIKYRYGIAEIPISSLAGMNLTGASVTFHFYNTSSELSRTLDSVTGGRFEGDGVVTQADYARARDPNRVSLISYATGGYLGLGWSSIDASSYIQAQLASGYNWASFYFMPYVDGNTGNIAAAEDSQGRGAYLEVVPVPEPSSLLALFAGASCIGGMIIRRRK